MSLLIGVFTDLQNILTFTCNCFTVTPCHRWDYHIKDGYKRTTSSGTSTPTIASWDGLKASKIVHELEKVSSFGYGAPGKAGKISTFITWVTWASEWLVINLLTPAEDTNPTKGVEFVPCGETSQLGCFMSVILHWCPSPPNTMLKGHFPPQIKAGRSLVHLGGWSCIN